MRIPVVDSGHRPLMPTTPARARKWIASGKAVKRWSDCGQFYVQLTVEPSGRAVQSVVIGIDPGKLYSGIGVQSARFTLYAAHLVLPFKTVCERMEQRRIMRRGRRGRRINRKVPYHLRVHRRRRFDNRRSDKIPPSIRANRQLELRVVAELCKIYPISGICYEYIRVDVDLSSGRRGARSGEGFSPVMVGQCWMLTQLERFAPVVKVEGHVTAATRKYLGLVKNHSEKSKVEFNTHAVDGVALACTHFVKYQQFHKAGCDGANWRGSVAVTNAPFYLVRRPPISRRQLHLLVPAKGGTRRKYGGTVTRHGFRKGDLVKAVMGKRVCVGWVSGDTQRHVSVSDCNWRRLGQFSASKVSLIARSTGLVVSGVSNSI